MALVTRTITNLDDEVCDQEGTPLANVQIDYQLVDANGTPIDTWDTISGERIVSKITTALTNASGVHSVSLWPNDRGSDTTQYLCTPNLAGTAPFMATLQSEALSDIKWIDFWRNGVPIVPGEINVVYTHIADVSIHREILYGTAETTDPTGLADGSIYIQYTA